MIKIGKILKPFGVRGEVKVYSYTDFPFERFAHGNRLVSENEKGERLLLKVVDSRPLQEPCWAIRFETITTMNDADKIRDYYLYLEEKDIPALPEGEYYSRELLHCDVYQSSGKVGTVIAVNEGIACNYLRVLTNEKKEKLIPFLPRFILTVDKEAKKIEIVSMDGLL